MEELDRMHFIEPYFAEVVFKTICLVSHTSAILSPLTLFNLCLKKIDYHLFYTNLQIHR